MPGGAASTRAGPGGAPASPVTSSPAFGGEAQVQGGRTEPPDVAYHRQQPRQHLGLVRPACGVVAEPGGDQGLAQVGDGRAGQPPAGPVGAPAADRRPLLAVGRVADHPGDDLAVQLGGQRDGVLG